MSCNLQNILIDSILKENDIEVIQRAFSKVTSIQIEMEGISDSEEEVLVDEEKIKRNYVLIGLNCHQKLIVSKQLPQNQ